MVSTEVCIRLIKSSLMHFVLITLKGPHSCTFRITPLQTILLGTHISPAFDSTLAGPTS